MMAYRGVLEVPRMNLDLISILDGTLPNKFATADAVRVVRSMRASVCCDRDKGDSL